MNDSIHPAERPPRVFITYAHDSADHVRQVRRFATFLRSDAGIDAHMDAWYENERRDWSQWAMEQLEQADYVLAIASEKFRDRADGRATDGVGWGSKSEGAYLREKMSSDRPNWIRRILPVVLPGHTIDEIPCFLHPHMATHYIVPSITMEGIGDLHRALTRRPRFPLPKLGDYGATLPDAEGELPTAASEALRRQRSRSVLLTSLRPSRRDSDIHFGDADIDGKHYSDSIICRPQLFASVPRSAVEYDLGRAYQTFAAMVGVLDDAIDADQVGRFQVFCDGEQCEQTAVRHGHPAGMHVDVTGVLRLRLVTYRPGTTASPLLAGARIAGGRSNNLPELAWGDPRLSALR
ncbi:MAG TPA: SEFIR domain-containing protein [Pseudonocardiaceae bacterium]|nr:SEFIR domain-containing protein [Pseudonocardiaceae bacterium]